LLKTRKKWISVLLTLAMLVGLMVPLAAPAVADDYEYAKFSAGFTYVDAEDNQNLGKISIANGDDLSSVSGSVYIQVTLPDGVEYKDAPTIGDANSTAYATGGSIVGATDNSITVEANNIIATDVEVLFNGDSAVDIDSDVTGNITAEVKVWESDGTQTLWEQTYNATVGKIASGDVTVSAKSAKKVTVGSNKQGAKITIAENEPGALSADPGDDEIFITIQKSGVKWDKTNLILIANQPVASGLTIDPIVATSFTNSDKTLKLTVATASGAFSGKIEITPRFIVNPGASEGDISVKVSGDDVDDTELVVATVGEGDVAVEVEKADKDSVKLGRKATFDDVKITLNPDTNFAVDDYFSITLPEGLKWKDVDSSDTTPVDDNSGNLEFVDLVDSDRTAWFIFGGNESSDVELTNLDILADYDAELGDLEVTFGGAVEGSYKIGAVKVSFTVEAEKVNVPLLGSDIAAGKIVITETGAGALIATDDNDDKDDWVPGYFDIKLPMGVTFARTPEVDVTDGDLDLGTVSVVDDNKLRIQIEGKSNLKSTFEITDIYYNIDNRATEGDITLKIGEEYNLISDNALAKVANATIVSERKRDASFAIDSTTYVVNGTEYTMDVAPYVTAAGRTYMPVRYLAYALGVSEENVYWDAAAQTVTLLKGTTAIQLTIGSNVLKVNGISLPMDVAPEIKDGRTMLPARFVAEALGASVGYDEATQTVTINLD